MAHALKDNIDVEVYPDGSLWFKPRSPGAKSYGCNELLNERRSRAKAQGRSADFTVGVVTSKKATCLDYQKINLGRELSYLVIDSDLDRSHMPQEWAAGLLPIIPADRFWAWYETPSPASASILRFTPPQDFSDANAMRLVETYLFLLLDSWTQGTGLRPQDARRLLNNLGFRVDARETRKALDALVEQGWIETFYNVPPKGGGYEMWRYSPNSLSYHRGKRASAHPIHDYFAPDSMQIRSEAYLSLWEAFVPYLNVPSLPARARRRAAA